jgi:glutathione transport system substrate-binding protein
VRSKRILVVAAVAATLSVVGTACAAPEDNEGESSKEKTSLNAGWNQPFYSYNELTATGHNSANVNIKYLLNDQFWYYDPDSELQANTDFGTYEQTSEDPLTVKYTINDDVKWSDGTPVDAADMLLWWAAASGKVNTIAADKVKKDKATGLPENTEGKVYFDTASPGLGYVSEMPEISEDGKSLTMVYDEKFADWRTDMLVNVPAHVTAEKALGISDPQEAKEALVKAVQEKDTAALVKISSFWNTGYDFTAMPEDKDLALSSGAYVMKDLKENEYMTLEKNPGYKGEHEASIDTLTVRFSEDPLAQVQALENGELDVFSPQVTADAVQAAEKLDDVRIAGGAEGSWEHLDLTFNNKGPFDPATYGGDEEVARQVRQAFLHAVPRQEVVDKLIRPINPEAQVRNSFLRTEGAPGYDEIVAQNGISEYAAAEPRKSLDLLEQAGVQKPIDVRVMYAKGNVRRENQFQLFKPALTEAGFNVIDKGDPNWSDKLGSGEYDAVFFAWEANTTGVSDSSATFVPGGATNFSGYSNPSVDAAFDELAVEQDESRKLELQIQIEQEIVKDAYGLTLFQHPAATIWNTQRVSGIHPAVLSPTMFYGFWDWELPD